VAIDPLALTAKPLARVGPGSVTLVRMNRVDPKKLLLSKWTAVTPVGKDKHFLVARVPPPEPPGAALEWVEIEAVFSRRGSLVRWRDLKDATRWRRGWV
jgi:tryptophan-rich hypothetical protein